MASTRADIIKERLEQLASYSDRPDCLCRAFGSDATIAVNQLVSRWMQEAGLETHVDNIGNVRGIKINQKPKLFLMGSHLDTVMNAGKYDGPLGVLLAIDQAQYIDYSLFPHDFEVVGFANEEGMRFSKCYLGSHVVAGGFQRSWLKETDDENIALETAISKMGGTVEKLQDDAITAQSVAGYLEVHIEQGPVLENLNYPLGVVSHISAQQRHLVTFEGQAGHAGTVPMEQRKDALTGAAEFILEIEKVSTQNTPMVATVGRLDLVPGASNIIPQSVKLSVDIRHHESEALAQTISGLKQTIEQICFRRKLKYQWKIVQEENTVACDPELTEKLQQSLADSQLPVKVLTSGAGHDAVAMSKVTPVSMLFVRCKDGISHNPLEEASVEDIASAINVCDQFFKKF